MHKTFQNIEELDGYFLKTDSENLYLKNRPLIISVLSELEKIQSSGFINDGQKELIELALSSQFEGLTYNIIGVQLSALSAKFDDIKNYLLDLSNANKAEIRFNNVVNAQLIKDEHFRNEIYQVGLKDKSQKVLEKTIEEVLSAKKIKIDFLHLVKDAINCIKNGETKSFLTALLEMNQKGYAVEKNGSNYCIYVKKKKGFLCWDVNNEKFEKIKNLRIYIFKELLKNDL